MAETVVEALSLGTTQRFGFSTARASGGRALFETRTEVRAAHEAFDSACADCMEPPSAPVDACHPPRTHL